MKSILLTLTATLLLNLAYSQKAVQKETEPIYDTVVTSFDRILVLDSLTYTALVNLVGATPASQSKSAGIILNAIDGSKKNVFFQPVYGLKARQKK